MPVLQILPLLVFPVLVLGAALRDITSYTIPNWISLAAAVLFFPAALVVGLPLNHVGFSLGIGAATLVFGIGMFAAGWVGGGDAKLMAACALWLGWPAVLPFLAWTALAGGAMAVGLLCARKVPVLAGRGPAWMSRLLQPGEDVPYGVAIAAGALIAFPDSAIAYFARGLI